MSILAGRYELERRLGGGGMAEVFLAKLVGKDGFSRHVAIKRVLAHLATDEAFAKMFVAEAQMCAKLQHPNIVSVLDFDRDDEGRPFLVIELVDGPSLAELADGGALPVGAAVHLATELLRGLAYAHDLPSGEGVRGIVHRDISPHNVLLSWEGAVKVSDFGIAKARAASGVTASELLKGKPAYMSPEQANGEALDGRSDLFAVGVVLWELLAGRSLFAGHTTQETLARVLFAPIPSPRSICAEIPADVDAVVMKLLARERDHRYADANDAIAALVACDEYPRDGRDQLVALLAERFAANAPQRARMIADVPTVRTPAEYAPTLPAPRDARRSRARPIALALAGIAIAVVAVAITRLASRDTANAPVAPRDATAHDATALATGDETPHDAVRDEAARDATVASPVEATRVDAVVTRKVTPPHDSVVGKSPNEADLVAERARIMEASKGPASVPFSPPDETSVDATKYFESARAEVRRLFGRDGKVTSISYSGLRGDGHLDGTKMGHGIAFAFAIIPPTEDGFHCVEFSSNYANISPRFRMKLITSEAYCTSLKTGAALPRCSATELYRRAVALGFPNTGALDARFMYGKWELNPAGQVDWEFETTTPNDCH